MNESISPLLTIDQRNSPDMSQPLILQSDKPAEGIYLGNQDIIKPEEVFSLVRDMDLALPIENNQRPELQKKRDEYLHTLLSLTEDNLPQKNRIEVRSKIGTILAKTLEYYLAVVPVMPFREKINNFLEGKLADFDPEEMDRARDRRPLLNVKLVTRFIKKKDFLGAYQAFWGGWNPQPHTATRSVYDAIGGNDRPVLSTLGSFFYSGLFLHAFHPYILPMYAVETILGRPDMIATNAALVTGAYVAMGIPVAIKKGIDHVRSK